ncbi:phenylacetic acid degradation protein [Prauserella sp. PE36]|uniref:PaaI family thioesterase n=1 Tax=Prauserella sp. PE36 TaxID=1504709 RepID=UPI000DE37933|nr:PaaI family thioesterase [Prauserella sp. PE36]RBM22037.1 phenylacetic acid degradation protein [Prauserella sp. PE36]
MTGLETLRALLRGDLPPAGIGKTLGFRLVDVGDGWAVFEGGTGEHLYNPARTVHGGYFATLLDSALACAVMSKLPEGTTYTTVQLNVNLLRRATAATGTLRATATAVHVGRTIGTAEARLEGVDDGKLYAHATTTCAILAAR